MWSRLVSCRNRISSPQSIRATEAATLRRQRRQFSCKYQRTQDHCYSYRKLAAPLLVLLVVLQDYSVGVVGASSSSTSSLSSSCDDKGRKENPRLRIYLVRHGESASNLLGLYAGQDDVPLTDEGQQQATRLGLSMSTKWPTTMFWRLYSSDLIRATNTAFCMLRQQQQEHDDADDDKKSRTLRQNEVMMERLILDKRLRERSYGARQGMPRQLTEEQALLIWKSHNLTPPIYETNEDLWQRGSEWLLEVWKDLQTHLRVIHPTTHSKCNDEKEKNDEEYVYHVLVVTHAGIIREFLKHLFSVEELQALGAEWDVRGALIVPNTSVTIVEFELLDDHQQNSNFLHTASLVQVADASHLEQFQIHSD